MKKHLYRVMTDQDKSLPAGCIKILLWCVSLVYGIVVRFIGLVHSSGITKPYRFHQRVISVGNITVGGVGKTPLVVYIAGLLRNNACKPAVLIRGYMDGGAAGGFSDEAEELKEKLRDTPVLVGADRITNAKKFLEKNSADVFILDDGFQHRKIARDLNIAVVDSSNPFGNGHLLPRGILREPVSSLKRADMIVLTKINLSVKDYEQAVDRVKKVNPGCFIAEAEHRPVKFINVFNCEEEDVTYVKGKDVCSFCSIGDPKSFSRTLDLLGAKQKKNFVYMDHHVYTDKDIKEINEYCLANNIKTILTTQKDAVKLTEILKGFDRSFKVLMLVIELRIVKGEDALTRKILKIVEK